MDRMERVSGLAQGFYLEFGKHSNYVMTDIAGLTKSGRGMDGLDREQDSPYRADSISVNGVPSS